MAPIATINFCGASPPAYTGGNMAHGTFRSLSVLAVLLAIALAIVTYFGVEVLLRSEETGVLLSVIRRDRSRV